MFHPQGPTFFELARQALSSTQHGYDLLADKFDLTPFRTPDWILQWTGQLISEFAPVSSAIDICCGTGAGLDMLRPHCADRMVGIDFSQGMLDVAKKNLSAIAHPTIAHPTIELINQDFLNSQFDEEFDLAVSFSAFGHISNRDQPRFIRRIYQLLKPGGRFVFVTHRMPPISSTEYWFCRGFNLAMRVRNLVWRPPFIMYYLTFLWPEIEAELRRHGFTADVREPDAPGANAVVVMARKN